MEDRQLYIIWTNADPITSEHMVMMYSTNSMLNGWWDKVTVVVWGNSQLTATQNEAVKLKIALAQQAGVEFSSCLSCAINLGTKDALEEMGIEVIRWGEKLSGLIQGGANVMTV
ncbi:MAG: DsrE family protein [Bacillota bacterium]|nr:DsrE family protein [Bacillota bacterium]